MINKNNETLESLQIKLELAKKLRTTKKNGSTIPDLDLPFNEFILECYLHSYPCSYGKYIEQGEVKISEATDYNSHNTTRLDVPAMKTLLMKLRFMQAILRGEIVESEE
jgi:hypothetical protein